MLQTQPKAVLAHMLIPDLSPRLIEIRCPVLGFWGTEDHFCPVSGANKILAAVGDARMVLLAHCGHWAMLEYPDVFNRYVIDFLATDRPRATLQRRLRRSSMRPCATAGRCRRCPGAGSTSASTTPIGSRSGCSSAVCRRRARDRQEDRRDEPARAGHARCAPARLRVPDRLHAGARRQPRPIAGG